MTTQEAIMGFSQSEKIKAGLIWASQSIEMALGLPESEKKAGSTFIKMFLDMIAQEAGLAQRIQKDAAWTDAVKHMDKAIVMVNSGVLHEATFHLTNALSCVTTTGQRSLQYLQDEGVISI